MDLLLKATRKQKYMSSIKWEERGRKMTHFDFSNLLMKSIKENFIRRSV